MPWQDLVIAVGSWIFVVALIPSVRSKEKPALSTSVVTATVLVAFAVAYASLSLWAATLSVAATSTMWWVLAYQKWRQNKTNTGA